MLKAIAFTQGQRTPSARFRVRQYVAPLAAEGLALAESPAAHGSYPPAGKLARLPWLLRTLAERARAARQSEAFDVALFQREMVSTLYGPERLCRVPAVLDVDDAIWLTQRWGSIDRLARRCERVICGNAYLAEHFSAFAPVEILPTAVDTDFWQPGERETQPVMVWSGSASGLPYLQAIEAGLHAAMQARPDLRLRVCSNVAPRFARLPAGRVEFLPWSPETELAAVQGAWLGLMPMPDTPWTRGKCAFKMLTYLACGVPCVASPYGMNPQVIAGGGALSAVGDAQWREQILALVGEPLAARSFGMDGRHQVEQRYAVRVLAGHLAAILKTVAGRAD